MKEKLYAVLTLAVVALGIWGILALGQWLGGLWGTVIDGLYEHELTVISEVRQIPATEIEIQWYEKDRALWLTRDGQYLDNLPDSEGTNRFRVFIKERPTYTFKIHRNTPTQKMKFEFSLRENEDALMLQAKWEPHFYSDDGARSAPFYERVKLDRNRIMK
ncbi:MAG: hypothetical protein CMN76_03920 [Spirochaetaceae bacterium]|nr:hypothetical protein [Spirochaetaceae bacterium]|tara:strand:+ start:248788 stop:249270 length:483 start_codon:yes stop_codon:yes gene_type:complete